MTTRRGRPPLRQGPACTTPACPRLAHRRGLCRAHYDAARAAGTLPEVERAETVDLHLYLSPALHRLVELAADEAGLTTTEGLRRAARLWLMLGPEARRTAGAVMLADEDT